MAPHRASLLQSGLVLRPLAILKLSVAGKGWPPILKQIHRAAASGWVTRKQHSEGKGHCDPLTNACEERDNCVRRDHGTHHTSGLHTQMFLLLQDDVKQPGDTAWTDITGGSEVESEWSFLSRLQSCLVRKRVTLRRISTGPV